MRRERVRRFASAALRSLYRAATPIDRLVHWRHPTPLPPAHLRVYYYRTLNPRRFVRVCENAALELTSRGLRPEHRVLDIGSGIGNLALGLAGYLQATYDGLEIHREATAWCQRAITSRHPKFRFHHADLRSGAYNPRGAVSPATYRFPFHDGAFDFVFLASVFTHMLPDGVENYLREIRRVLVPDGVCVESYFLLNDQTRTGIDSGLSFMSFDVRHPSGLCRLHSERKPEAAVALDEAFVLRAHQEAGLGIRDVRRGAWWNGEPHQQDVVTARSMH